jgi:hypothetical protein
MSIWDRPRLNVYLFDAGQKDEFRGQAQILLDGHVKRSWAVSLKPRNIWDRVTGEIMLTVYPVRGGNFDIRTSFERLNTHRFEYVGNIGQGK